MKSKAKPITAVLLVVLLSSGLATANAQTPDTVVVEGQQLTIDSIESGTVVFRTSKGDRLSHSLADLSPEIQKRAMELTGWGRIWEDNTGKFRSIADLVEVKEDVAVLERIGGKRIEVPLASLSKADRLYVEIRRTSSTDSLPPVFVAKVVGIADGDTVTVLLSRRQFKVRISGIDAPEKGQDFGSKAKKHLGDLVHGKFVSGVTEETDRYGRNVCSLTIDGDRVDYNLLKNGLAWHYVQYSNDPNRSEFEMQAKTKKLNIWSEAGPIPPWDWRKWGSAQRKQWLAEQNRDQITQTPRPPQANSGTLKQSSATATVTQTPRPPHANDGTLKQSSATTGYWISSNSGIRHNSSCRWYETSKGRHCSSTDGKACKKCGG